MAEINGATVAVYIGGVAVGSQTGCSFSETTAEIDVSNKDSRTTKLLAGRYSAKVTLDAMYVPSDAAFAALKTAMRAGTSVTLARYYSGSSVESATAIVTEMSQSFPDQEGGTCSASFSISGSWS